MKRADAVAAAKYRPDHGTGYAITFAEFRSIISDPAWQNIARAPLHEWFGYAISGDRDIAKVVSATGEEIDLLTLHRRLQAAAQKQYALYQRAMSVWR